MRTQEALGMRFVDELKHVHLIHSIIELIISLMIIVLRMINLRMGYVDVQVRYQWFPALRCHSSVVTFRSTGCYVVLPLGPSYPMGPVGEPPSSRGPQATIVFCGIINKTAQIPK